MNPRRRALVSAMGAQGILGLATAHANRTRVVGYLSAGNDGADIAAALARRGIDFRLEVRYSREPSSDATGADVLDRRVAVAELVKIAPDVLITFRLARTLALMRATRTIPIVCGFVDDPVGHGIAKSLARPGYNVTGLSGNAIAKLRLLVGLLRLVVPGLRRVVGIFSPDPYQEVASKVFEAEMRRAGVEGERRVARNEAEVEQILATRDATVEAVLLDNRPEAETRRLALAAMRRGVVLVGIGSSQADTGLLMGIKMAFSDPTGRIADLTAKILGGAKAGEVPFEVADQVHVEINRGTAEALALPLPPALLLRATRVIG